VIGIFHFLNPVEDISYGLVNHGFDVISIKQILPPIDHLQKEQPQ
jgi:hypothetical protein